MKYKGDNECFTQVVEVSALDEKDEVIKKLENALLDIPKLISNKDVSMAAYRLLRDHIEKVIGRNFKRFDYMGKRFVKANELMDQK